jgi:hypothetical protein
MRPIRSALFAAALLSGVAVAGQALAWGAAGHRLIGQLAVETLPLTLPAFLHTREASDQIGDISREPDRSRNSGQPHDADLDPGHFIDIDDQGKTLAGVPITAMPRDREAYETAVHAAGTSLYKAGYLYYNMVDGYEQLVKDFAYYRIETAEMKVWTDLQQRAWLAADLKLREALIIRDLGWWSHFIGDASQPMHASIHYNGWGDFPNPHNYTQEKIHGPFEGAFVVANLTKDSVRAAMPPENLRAGTIQACTADYLAVTAAKTEPLYALWTDGGFKPGDRRGVAFATERVAAAAGMLRDLVTKAWIASEDGSAGHPEISVRAVEAGATVPFATLYGDD